MPASRLLASEREYRFPVGFHIDNGPTFRLGDVERLIELSDGGLAVVSPFAFGIGVVNDKGKTDARASLGPFQHLQVAVGIAERGNRTTADMHLDADGFSDLVVNKSHDRHFH